MFSNMSHRKEVVRGKEISYYGSFCKVDDKLCDLIEKYAKDRVIVDVGAGTGLLGHVIEGVVSIDRYPHYQYKDNPFNFTYDSMEFPFYKGMFPVFLRPEHHIQATLFKNLTRIKDFFYVTRPKHVETHVHLDPEFYDIEVLDWNTGEEQAYHVTINYEKIEANQQYFDLQKDRYKNKDFINF